MNIGPHPHDAGMSLPDVTERLGGYMALSNATFDVDSGTLTGIPDQTGPLRAPCSTRLPGRAPFTKGE